MMLEKERNYGLDCFRIGLAILVFLYHSRIHASCNYWVLNSFISEGYLSMTGFFMLSGFSLMLVYGTKELRSRLGMSLFYKKRFVSIYPLYIVTGSLFVMIMISGGFQSLKDNLILLPIELICVQSIYENSLFAYSHNGGTWFISCLGLCYLLFPLIKESINDNSKRLNARLLVFCVSFVIYIPIIGRCFSEGSLYTNPLYRLVEFVIGALISRMCISAGFSQIYLNSYQKFIVVAIVLLCLFCGVSYSHRHELGIEWIVVVSFVAILLLIGFVKKKSNRLVTYISNVTYAFFLAQYFVWYPMKFFLKSYPQMPNVARILVPFIVSIAISIALHHIVEVKSGIYLKKLFKLC